MRNIHPLLLSIICLLAGLQGFGSTGIDVHDTKMLSEPAICKKHIAFVYAHDIWVANINGEQVRRLTSHKGIESHPVFSPDGTLIAFSGQYDGNTDVFIV